MERSPQSSLRSVCGKLATSPINRCAQVALRALAGVRPAIELEVVEVGCGAGGASFELSKVVGGYYHVVLPCTMCHRVQGCDVCVAQTRHRETFEDDRPRCKSCGGMLPLRWPRTRGCLRCTGENIWDKRRVNLYFFGRPPISASGWCDSMSCV